MQDTCHAQLKMVPDSVNTLLPQFLQMPIKLYSVEEIKLPRISAFRAIYIWVSVAEPTIVELPPPQCPQLFTKSRAVAETPQITSPAVHKSYPARAG